MEVNRAFFNVLYLRREIVVALHVMTNCLRNVSSEIYLIAFGNISEVIKIVKKPSNTSRGVFREGIWGPNSPPHFLGVFFNLLGFFKKKIPKPPKLSRPYKKMSDPCHEKFLDMALNTSAIKINSDRLRVNCNSFL